MSHETIEKFICKSTSALNNRNEILLNDFILLLIENIRSSRSVNYYADLLAISVKKLNNISKTYSGKTAKEFIEEKIIIDSQKLLIETPDTVKEISYSMGFTEPTNFNKFLKNIQPLHLFNLEKSIIKEHFNHD